MFLMLLQSIVVGDAVVVAVLAAVVDVVCVAVKVAVAVFDILNQ